jgi:hypothetical protein
MPDDFSHNESHTTMGYCLPCPFVLVPISIPWNAVDFEVWNANPPFWERYLAHLPAPQPRWVEHEVNLQSTRLSACFHDWRRQFCSGRQFGERGDSAPAVDGPRGDRLVDRMDGSTLDAAVYSLTKNFLYAVGPEARALGVPPEGLLWAALTHLDIMAKDYTFGDMLRMVLRAYEVWSEFDSIEFTEPEKLEAFVFKVIDTRVRQLFPTGWDGASYDDIEVEFRLLRDFCDHSSLMGGHSSFGRAMACGVEELSVPADIDEFRRRADIAVKKFDRMVIEVYIPF